MRWPPNAPSPSTSNPHLPPVRPLIVRQHYVGGLDRGSNLPSASRVLATREGEGEGGAPWRSNAISCPYRSRTCSRRSLHHRFLRGAIYLYTPSGIPGRHSTAFNGIQRPRWGHGRCRSTAAVLNDRTYHKSVRQPYIYPTDISTPPARLTECLSQTIQSVHGTCYSKCYTILQQFFWKFIVDLGEYLDGWPPRKTSRGEPAWVCSLEWTECPAVYIAVIVLTRT